MQSDCHFNSCLMDVRWQFGNTVPEDNLRIRIIYHVFIRGKHISAGRLNKVDNSLKENFRATRQVARVPAAD